MGDNLPNILRTIYNSDKIRMKDETEEEMAVLAAFLNKKNDMKYFNLLENTKKKTRAKKKIA